MRFDMRKDYVINGTQLAYVFACLGQEDIDEAVKTLEDVLKVRLCGQSEVKE